jgi:hypothetical protein
MPASKQRCTSYAARVSGFLLFPEDEVLLVEHLIHREGLALLVSDDMRDGPKVVERFTQAQPLPPPANPLHTSPEPDTFVFWVRALGELRTLADGRPRQSAIGRVERLLTEQAAGGDSGHLLDQSRSPILRWRRSHWHPNGTLCPGLLQAQVRRTKEQPVELLRLHSRVNRWMKAHSTELDPFDHAPEEARERKPENLQAFSTWAFPTAWEWIRNGGGVWPWNA